MKKKVSWWTREGMDELQVSQLAAGLSVLTEVQTELGGVGSSTAGWADADTESVRTSFLALLDAIAAPEPHRVDPVEVADDVGDVLMFLGHVVRYASVHSGPTPRQLAEAFQAKMTTNRTRRAG